LRLARGACPRAVLGLTGFARHPAGGSAWAGLAVRAVASLIGGGGDGELPRSLVGLPAEVAALAL